MRVAFDIGGTFTDVIIMRDDGAIVSAKVLSLLDDIGAQVDGLVKDRGDGVVEHFVHGTTVASNMVIEGTTAPTALLTTPGFRDILGIRGQRRPNIYDPTWERPPALVPRRWSREVRGRIRGDGAVDEELDLAPAAEVVRDLLADGVEAIAVCLVNSYVNPEHEEQLGRLIAELAPGVPVVLSSRLNPEMGEYERASTTAINASLVPGIRGYLAALERGLSGLTDRLLVMRSNGGVMTGALARDYPVNMIESGPAAGALAAARLAREAGLSQALAFDMGGTTAKACLIQDGVPLEKPGGEIGPGITAATRLFGGGGYAVRVPSLDIVEVGAGGGSIAWIDESGALRVGPRSAGADPGPACYARGGSQPTVTDANLVLGYLNPDAIAGDTVSLDHDAAFRAVNDVIAAPLGLDVRDAALGICEVANATMMRALRAVTTERGRDPRRCSLIAFGGAGAMHAARLATYLGVTEIHVPLYSGVFSAVGLLFADFRTDYVRSVARPLDELPASMVAGALREMEEQAFADMTAQGVAREAVILERHAELRARGQTAEVGVELPVDLDAAGIVELLPQLFAKQHLETFGHAPTGGVELLSLRLRARVAVADTAFADLAGAAGAARSTGTPGERTVYFGRHGGTRTVPVLDRWLLDGRVEGPLVIEEPDATVVVPPQWTAERDDLGSIVITTTG